MLELGVPPVQVRLLLNILNIFCMYVAFSFTFYWDQAADGKHRCPVCLQLRKESDLTPDGQIHCVLGRLNKIWCTYTKDKIILETFETEQKELMQVAWLRVNEAKWLKKQQRS